MASNVPLPPLHVFRFQVQVTADSLASGPQGQPIEMSFAERTGLEATVEPKAIKEGGRNYGPAQRAGTVTFATVVLKRGVTTDRAMWQIFNASTSGAWRAPFAGDHHAARRPEKQGHGLAIGPRHAGEIQVCRPECGKPPRSVTRNCISCMKVCPRFNGIRNGLTNTGTEELPHGPEGLVEIAFFRRWSLTVQFNPASLVYTVENSSVQQGRDPQRRQHISHCSAKLTMDLQFDTTDTGVDVRQLTNVEVALSFMESSAAANKKKSGKGESKPAPPVLSFDWGAYHFQGFMESFKETIDFFSADGIPLRALVGIGPGATGQSL